MMRRLLYLLLICSVSLPLFFSGSTFAATTENGAQGLQISPVTINLDVIPGGTYLTKITVRNVTPNNLIIRTNVNNFQAKDESGVPKILLDEDEPKELSLAFKSWVTPVNSFSLGPNSFKELTISINVPEDAEVGGHYGVIRFSGLPPNITSDEANKVSINASLGPLVLIKVAGTIKENLAIKELYVAKGDKKSSLVETGPLNIVSRFENTGNVHVKPEGILTIKNMFGGTVATLPFTSEPGNILPQSIRKFEQTLKNKWLIGKYTVVLDTTYGSSNQSLGAKISFWAIPYKLILATLILVAGLVFGIRKLIKSYNAKIISKHSGKK